MIVRGGALVAVALLIGCAARSPPLSVQVSRAGDGCSVEVGGRRFAYPTEIGEKLLTFVQAWPNRRAVLNLMGDTPYRCVGGTIFTLQRAGFQKIDMLVDGRPSP